jgi:hypothetical protein
VVRERDVVSEAEAAEADRADPRHPPFPVALGGARHGRAAGPTAAPWWRAHASHYPRELGHLTGAGTVLRMLAGPVRTTLFSDAGCPWAYSAVPALRVLDWRYGDQLEWRLVLIGPTERAEQYVERGYTPLKSARGYARHL